MASTTRILSRQALRLTTTTHLRLAVPSRSILRPTPSPRTTHTSTQCPSLARFYSTPAASSVEPPDHLDERELHIFNSIKSAFNPTQLEVQDVSGGCGSMYALDITSEAFRGLTVIKQHRLVNGALKEEIKGWHGVQLKTRAP